MELSWGGSFTTELLSQIIPPPKKREKKERKKTGIQIGRLMDNL